MNLYMLIMSILLVHRVSLQTPASSYLFHWNVAYEKDSDTYEIINASIMCKLLVIPSLVIDKVHTCYRDHLKEGLSIITENKPIVLV